MDGRLLVKQFEAERASHKSTIQELMERNAALAELVLSLSNRNTELEQENIALKLALEKTTGKEYNNRQVPDKITQEVQKSSGNAPAYIVNL